MTLEEKLLSIAENVGGYYADEIEDALREAANANRELVEGLRVVEAKLQEARAGLCVANDFVQRTIRAGDKLETEINRSTISPRYEYECVICKIGEMEAWCGWYLGQWLAEPILHLEDARALIAKMEGR